MQIIKVNPKKYAQDEIDLIVDYFKRGKVVVYPTDTVYGIGCLATDKKAINKIKKIKGREKNKPMLVLIKSFCQLREYCFINKKQDAYLHKTWKTSRPVSVIVKHRNLFSKELTSGLETVGVRIPADLPKNEFLGKILKEVNNPIVSTSLNLSGGNVLASVKNLDKKFIKVKPDLVIDVGIVKNTKSSKIVDITNIENIKKIR